MFNKVDLNTLLLHSPNDFEIRLEPSKTERNLSFSPLYKYSLVELKTTYKYITKNLKKGFIEPNNTAYTALILFVPKPNSKGLRFYVDYCKLNSIIQKD